MVECVRPIACRRNFPGLMQVVAAYSPDAFNKLLRTGEALGGRSLPVMGPRARQNLSQLTDAEITALYSYLHDLH